MGQHKCELCGTPVKVVGKTTKHYEPIRSVASVLSVNDIIEILVHLKSFKFMTDLTRLELARSIHALLSKGKVNAQRQDSLADQMNTVIDLARKEGCYDAQDWIIRTFGSEGKEPQWPLESKAPVRETGDHRAYWYNLGRADAIKAWKDAQKGLV